MKRLTATAGTKSKLAKPVQELIKTIFDVESMKKAMVEFEVRLFYLFGQYMWLCVCEKETTLNISSLFSM